MADVKKYMVTEKAGRRVAGVPVPFETKTDKGGKVIGEGPQAGFTLDLTDQQAEYELLMGTIVEASEKPLAKSSQKAIEAPANGV